MNVRTLKLHPIFQTLFRQISLKYEGQKGSFCRDFRKCELDLLGCRKFSVFDSRNLDFTFELYNPALKAFRIRFNALCNKKHRGVKLKARVMCAR